MKTEFWEDFIVRLVPETEQDKAWLIAYVAMEECSEETRFKFLLHEKGDDGNNKEALTDHFGEDTDNPWSEMYALNIYPCSVG